MLGKNFVRLDGIVFPTPTSWTDKISTVENVHQSEAGTDLVDVVRAEKHVITAEWQMTSEWKARLENVVKSPTVFLYDGTSARIVRARDLSSKLEPHSETVKVSDGLWTMSVTFTEV